MAGGSEDAFATARPVLDDLAAKLTWLGPVGAGQTAKLVNQAIVCAGYVLMAEALALAEASGLDAAAVPGCLEGGLADSQLLRRLYPQMQQRDFDPPRNYARQVLKDLKAVVEHAGRADLALPLVATALERFSAYVDAGHAMHDSAGIIDLYKGGRDGASA
jgi:3-hydroxyisobutyrate dehydrogenase